ASSAAPPPSTGSEIGGAGAPVRSIAGACCSCDTLHAASAALTIARTSTRSNRALTARIVTSGLVLPSRFAMPDLADALLAADAAGRAELLRQSDPADAQAAIAALGHRHEQAAAEVLTQIDASAADKAL